MIHPSVRTSSETDKAAVDVRKLREERLHRLRQGLRQADCAGAVFFDPINIRYAVDASNMQVWCLHNPTRYTFVATEGPVVQFEFGSCEHLVQDIHTIDEVRPACAWTYLMAGPDSEARAGTWAREIADLVVRHGGGNRHLAVDRLDPYGLLALQRLGIEVRDGQALAEEARAVKTAEEIVAIRDAIAACEAAVNEMRAVLRPGMTEQAVWSVLHQQNIAGGGEWIETRLLASGPRTNPWYQECSDRVILDGDLVAFDTDLIGRHGYCCDISRTWRATDSGTKASDGQRRTYARAYDHLQTLLKLIRPGVTLEEIAQSVGAEATDARSYTCLLHGVGLCDEYPVGSWASQPHRYDATIVPGMTLCLESYHGPSDGSEGVKLEEQVLVTETGLEILSTLPFEEEWL